MPVSVKLYSLVMSQAHKAKPPPQSDSPSVYFTSLGQQHLSLPAAPGCSPRLYLQAAEQAHGNQLLSCTPYHLLSAFLNFPLLHIGKQKYDTHCILFPLSSKV